MDVNKLLETIERGLNQKLPMNRIEYDVIMDSVKALADLRAYITTQQQLLERAQAVASQQQATLEKVEAERRAYREQAQVLAANYEGVFYDWHTADTHGVAVEFNKAIGAIEAMIDLIEASNTP